MTQGIPFLFYFLEFLPKLSTLINFPISKLCYQKEHFVFYPLKFLVIAY